jgi:hypothetical protein
MNLRRIHLIKDVIYLEGDRALDAPITRVAACAVFQNPAAQRASLDLDDLIAVGAELGERLMAHALTVLTQPVIAYGKAAMVGVLGEKEHAAAILHPRMGKPIREAIGGGKAVIPSNAKVCGADSIIDVPLGHKDDPWSFNEIDTMSLMVPGAPLPDEIAVAIALSDGCRPMARV